MPALNVTNSIVLSVERATDGFCVRVRETGCDEKYVSDSTLDLTTDVDSILTEWADRTEPEA